jgi:hypothetical protein
MGPRYSHHNCIRYICHLVSTYIYYLMIHTYLYVYTYLLIKYLLTKYLPIKYLFTYYIPMYIPLTHLLTIYVVSLALGSQPRQGLVRLRAKRKPRSERKCERMNLHIPKRVSTLGVWSLDGLPNL